MKISCYPPLLRTMLWVLHIILMSPMICGSIVEETTALIHIRSTLEGRYSVPASWKQSDDCCSWERVRCNNGRRVVDLNLSDLRLNSTTGGGCWNLNLAIFSAFHELQHCLTIRPVYKALMVTSSCPVILPNQDICN